MKNYTSKERVLTALKGGQPDKVPFMESLIDLEMQQRIMRREDYGLNELAAEIGMDGFGYGGFLPPVFAEKKIIEGRENILNGHITSRDKLNLLKFPDPDDDALYRPAEEFIKRYQGDYALFASVRLGIAPTLWSMGMEAFSQATFEDVDFIKTVLEKYAAWTAKMIRNINRLGFDFIWTADDIAFRNGPIFSPNFFREVVLPILKIAVDEIEIPWIFHSDGNLMPVLDDLLGTLQPNGLHPIDPGSDMDLGEVKRKYGKQVCLVGNIDLNYTLTRGTPEEVDKEVKEKIAIASPGGGYMISSSNSITAYCKLENVQAMFAAIKKYRDY